MTDETNEDQPAPERPKNLREGRPPLENLLSDVPLRLTVELGRVTMSLREVVDRLGPGSVISLSKLTGEKLDVLINDRLVARGEAVAVGDRYGIRITDIVHGRGDSSS